MSGDDDDGSVIIIIKRKAAKAAQAAPSERSFKARNVLVLLAILHVAAFVAGAVVF